MIYKEAYKYTTGEMVFTYDGKKWFKLSNDNKTTSIKNVDKTKIAFKVK